MIVGQEISDEENNYRLVFIHANYYQCPICKNNIVEELDEWDANKLATRVFRYYCRKCGIVARKKVSMDQRGV